MTFEALDAMLEAGLTADLLAPRDDVGRGLLEKEVKLGCTSLMLTCLDRGHRLAFILGDVFDLAGPEAGGRVPPASVDPGQRPARAGYSSCSLRPGGQVPITWRRIANSPMW